MRYRFKYGMNNHLISKPKPVTKPITSQMLKNKDKRKKVTMVSQNSRLLKKSFCPIHRQSCGVSNKLDTFQRIWERGCGKLNPKTFSVSVGKLFRNCNNFFWTYFSNRYVNVHAVLSDLLDSIVWQRSKPMRWRWICNIFLQNYMLFYATIMPHILTLATLGDGTQTGPFLSVSKHRRWLMEVGVAQWQCKNAEYFSKTVDQL
jgi:hypothetical protein